MLATKLPPDLWQEFEQQAQKLYDDQDSVTRALAEAVELWLEKHRWRLQYEIKTSNDRLYNEIKERLEHEYPGKWIVIADGKLAGVAESLQATNEYAGKATDRIVYRVGEHRPREVELGWQMASD